MSIHVKTEPGASKITGAARPILYSVVNSSEPQDIAESGFGVVPLTLGYPGDGSYLPLMDPIVTQYAIQDKDRCVLITRTHMSDLLVEIYYVNPFNSMFQVVFNVYMLWYLPEYIERL